ncbi:hypothetical protein OIU34_19140 [Pararhizobium sp. BT-229]|uniref:hypothetical protein n=1 Tax=Pararhizobium sp. BT-229 TaxID=2986923 RepID=UPI0021F6DAAA|nr:hypothetical protein [Pararhizobium sp. BT-229]MCV9963998.1 hypothetical protein [Pararhizobium sp. BT-229]
MIRNKEVANILLLVGIDPAKVPARPRHVATRHVDLLVRYIGYKAGLQAAKQSRGDHDLDKEDTAILGDFIERRLTFRPMDHMDMSLFHEMRRLLALVEGATGYPMTTERTEKKALAFFLKAVLDDIRRMKAEYGPTAATQSSDAQIARPAPVPSI